MTPSDFSQAETTAAQPSEIRPDAAQPLETPPLKPSSAPTAPRLLLPAAFAAGVGITAGVLNGGWGFGFTAAFWILQTVALFFFWPRVKNRPWLITAAALSSFLAFSYARDQSPGLMVLNFFVLLVLCSAQVLLAGPFADHDWNRPHFLLEGIFTPLLRPFTALNEFGRALVGVFRPREADPAATPAGRRGKLRYLILGAILVLPLLFILVLLLMSADAAFRQLFAHVENLFGDIRLSDWGVNLLVGLLLTPFLYSILFSGRKGQRIFPGPAARPIPKTPQARSSGMAWTLVSALALIDLLYLVFAAIQLSVLTGLTTRGLPAGMTYSEYARQGFFQLTVAAALNVGISLVALQTGDRRTRVGMIIRVESLLLFAASGIVLASAWYRMQLYIGAYGLTQLRYWVSAFMILLAAIFIVLTIREFTARVPVVRALALLSLIAVVALNLSTPDARIARYNVQRALNQPDTRLDTQYFPNLSSAAVPAMLDLLRNSPSQSDQSIIACQLRSRYEQLEQDAERWQSQTFADNRARKLIRDAEAEIARHCNAASAQERAYHHNAASLKSE